MQKKLSKLQAYNVMLNFLEIFYFKKKSHDIGDLLSDSEFFWDGKTTADPASWYTWKKAIKITMEQDKSLKNENKLTYFQAFHMMLNYVIIYRSLWGETEDLDNLIQEIKLLYQSYDIKNLMWLEWFKISSAVSKMKNPRVIKELKKL